MRPVDADVVLAHLRALVERERAMLDDARAGDGPLKRPTAIAWQKGAVRTAESAVEIVEDLARSTIDLRDPAHDEPRR